MLTGSDAHTQSRCLVFVIKFQKFQKATAMPFGTSRVFWKNTSALKAYSWQILNTMWLLWLYNRPLRYCERLQLFWSLEVCCSWPKRVFCNSSRLLFSIYRAVVVQPPQMTAPSLRPDGGSSDPRSFVAAWRCTASVCGPEAVHMGSHQRSFF